MAEVAVLEGAREEHAFARGSLQLLARRPEADDDGSRVEVRERLEEQVHALLLAELPNVDYSRSLPGEELLEPPGVAGVRLSLRGGRRVPVRLLEERGERLIPRTRPELLDIHARRDDTHTLGPADDLCEDAPDVLGPGENLGRGGQALARPGAELLVPAHRELEFRSVRLDGEGHARCGADRRTEEDVVREQEIGRQVLPHDGRVLRDEAVAFGPAQVLEVAGLHVRVAVEHEDG